MLKRDEIVDIFRIISIWAVVAIHTTSTTIAMGGFHIDKTPLAFIFNQLLRFAVPLFFLISGYVLRLRYTTHLSIKNFYKKRLMKIVIPFVVWSAFYYIIFYHAGVKAFFVNFVSLITEGSAAEHLYFIPAIGILYALFPLLQYLTNRITPKKNILYYVLFFSISVSLLFLDYYNPKHLSLPTALRISLLNLNVFLIGIIIAQYKQAVILFTRKYKLLILSLFLLSMLFVLTEGQIQYALVKSPEYFTSQWRPSIFIYTILIFMLGITFWSKIPFYSRISKISSLTFFVFFSHIIFVHFFWKIFGAYLFSKSMGHIIEQFWFDPLVFVFVIICSYSLAFIVSFVPKIREILGINS